ncbi:MAG TPA: DUF11 domain-containing protein [Acidimicrobiales bacterium]|nr:DUF11 domain-containing protein [Acidimicrobiales bacterium]
MRARLSAFVAALPLVGLATIGAVPGAAAAPRSVAAGAPVTVSAATDVPYVVDPAVNNTVANFATTDTTGGSEPSVALDPSNPEQAVMTSFSGGWGANAPLWQTINGGQTWTQQFSIPAPPGRPAGCPCDQTVDFGRNGTLYGTFLINAASPSNNKLNVVSGSTTNPAQPASWSWNGNPVQLTNNAAPGNVDQPWLLVNRDTTTAANDDVYGAYDDFNANNGRVAVSLNATPPNFTRDQSSGSESPFDGANPGLRLAKDPANGRMYALWQTATAGPSGAGTSPHNVTIHLNRTADSGQNWTLNGNSGGITVAVGNQDEYNYSFGQANTLQGGVDHAAVDPSTGDVYIVFGRDDDGAGAQRNRIYIDRLTYDNMGNLNVAAGYPKAVSTSTDAALPSVAVTTDGVVGVLYDSFDGTSPAPGNFPIFTAHLARSTDQGSTFSDTVLKTFQSPTAGTGAQGRRDLGDFQQLKAEGTTLYGTFSGNRRAFSATANSVIDPIYFSTTTPSADLSTTKSATTDPITAGTDESYTITSTNNGPSDALSVTMSDTLPTNTTFVSLTPAIGWTCTTPAVGGTGTVSCTIATLANGASGVFTMIVHVSPSTPGGSTITNSATTTSSTLDLNPLNNTGSKPVAVVTSADLATTKTGPANVVPGTDATYTVTMTNNGPSDAAVPVLTDPIPAGTTFVSETHPAGWTCTDPAVGTTGPPLTCTAATLALNASASFTVTLHVSPAAAGTTVTNIATASSNTTDPIPGNNSGQAPTIVTCDHNLTANVPGSLTLSGGTWCLTNITVGGAIIVKPGTTVFVIHSTITGSITATNPAGFSACQSNLAAVTITGATGFVLIANPGDDLCLGNKINGAVSLTSNTGGVEVSHNVIVGGSMYLRNNTGGGPFAEDNSPEIEANQLSGSLICSGNSPAPTNDGQPNTVTGARTGQCASPAPL